LSKEEIPENNKIFPDYSIKSLKDVSLSVSYVPVVSPQLIFMFDIPMYNIYRCTCPLCSPERYSRNETSRLRSFDIETYSSGTDMYSNIQSIYQMTEGMIINDIISRPFRLFANEMKQNIPRNFFSVVNHNQITNDKNLTINLSSSNLFFLRQVYVQIYKQAYQIVFSSKQNDEKITINITYVNPYNNKPYNVSILLGIKNTSLLTLDI